MAVLCGLLVLAGAGAFLAGVLGPQPVRAWQVYLVNFLFWSGVSFGSLLFVALMNLVQARWGRPFKRLAEAPAAFLPLSYLLFWVLYLGRERIFPWIEVPVPGKEAWLNPGFLFLREGVGLFLLTAVSLALVYCSVRSDLEATRDGEEGDATKGDRGQGFAKKSWKVQNFLSPVLGILYGTVLSLVAFDLIMSLTPEWYSTLFGAYFFIGCFYAGLAGIVVLSAIAFRHTELRSAAKPRHFHNLGKLLFGMCLLTGYFFFSQLLLIWYGNLPYETRFLIRRFGREPWETLAWVVFFLYVAMPALILINRRIKMKLIPMFLLAIMVLVGKWLECFLLVVPSLWKGEQIPLGVQEVLITGGFFGAMVLCVGAFLHRYPLLPVSDPLFRADFEGNGLSRSEL